MKSMDIKKLYRTDMVKATILIAFILLVYLLISVYFADHFFFNTAINGVDVSLKAHDKAAGIIMDYLNEYKLQLIERNGAREEIIGQDIGMQYNPHNRISKIYEMQYPLKWPSSLFGKQKYYVRDLFVLNQERLINKIDRLNCLNKEMIEPQNVEFKYSNGSYEVIKEVYGNKIYKDKLYETIEKSILQGMTNLDLNVSGCYENPRYTINSDKALVTKNLLDKYISTRITYKLRSKTEILDQTTINQWLDVNEDLEVVIDEKAVAEYVKALSKKYDTAGVARKFKTSSNKVVEVKGGFYGWKINRAAEVRALIKDIKQGEVIEKEPVYIQKALSREENDIGNTYVEINITRQHLWFYKNGKIVTQGAIVTGNPNRGNSTKTGVYMLNYKQKGSILRGHNYEAEVTYWMPFYGNIGIHDASWRYSFGGSIYKRNGSHGCVNAPLYLAKTIFENIEEGTPIICYEE